MSPVQLHQVYRSNIVKALLPCVVSKQRQHSVSGLFRYLCDEALDTEALREALSQRVDGAEEVKKEMREDIAEDKRKLKACSADHAKHIQHIMDGPNCHVL